MMSSANPGKAQSDLGWKAEVHIDEVIIKMCEAESKI